MTASADCLVSIKVLFSDFTFSRFFLHFILLLVIIAITGFVQRGYKNEDFFSLLTIIYPKIDMNVVKAISPRQ